MPLVIITILLILTGLPISAEAQEDIPLMRTSRHMILPLIGYQQLNNEETGVSFYDEFWGYGREELHVVEMVELKELDHNVPILGIMYRYIPNPLLSLEANISALHSASNQNYVITYEYGGVVRNDVLVKRSNFLSFGGDAIINIPVPQTAFTNIISPSIRLGGGYTFREVNAVSKRLTGTQNMKLESLDATSAVFWRGGIDFSIWSSSSLLLKGSVYYSHFMPTNSDRNTFGGIGWKIAFFPIWSGR